MVMALEIVPDAAALHSSTVEPPWFKTARCVNTSEMLCRIVAVWPMRMPDS